MPLPATLNAFGQDQIDKARYGIQSQIYTFGPGTLPTGQSIVFSVQNWNTPVDNIAKVCIIDSLATSPQDANVQITWVADSLPSDQAQGWTDGYPVGTRALPVFIPAGSNLKLVVNNMRGTQLTTFQLNYGVTVMSLNLFQRLLLGFKANDADTVALNALRATQPDISSDVSRQLASGSKPFSRESLLMFYFENRCISTPKDTGPFHMTVPAGATQSVTKTISVPPGLIYILRGISLESASAGLNLVIDRDNDVSLVNQLNAAAFVQADDHRWEFFVPAKDHFGVYINGSPANYPVRLDIEAYMASDLMLGHLLMGTLTPKIQLGLQ